MGRVHSASSRACPFPRWCVRQCSSCCWHSSASRPPSPLHLVWRCVPSPTRDMVSLTARYSGECRHATIVRYGGQQSPLCLVYADCLLFDAASADHLSHAEWALVVCVWGCGAAAWSFFLTRVLLLFLSCCFAISIMVACLSSTSDRRIFGSVPAPSTVRAPYGTRADWKSVLPCVIVETSPTRART